MQFFHAGPLARRSGAVAAAPVIAVVSTLLPPVAPAAEVDPQVARGRYLVFLIFDNHA